MSDVSQGPGWWQASDSRWYPPRDAEQAPAPGWWLASDGQWYPPRESDEPPHPGWWLAADGKWYPPESVSEPEPGPAAATTAATTAPTTTPTATTAPTPESHPTAASGASGNGAHTADVAAPPSATPPPRPVAPRAPRTVAEATHHASPSRPRDASGQIRRRNEASRADAITQAPARFLAASRALQLLESEVGRSTPTTSSTPITSTTPTTPRKSNPSPARPTSRLRASDLREPVEPDPTPNGVAELTDDPAVVLADPPPPVPEGPLIEIRSSPLGADVEHLGEHLVVFADRVEICDRSGHVRRRLRDDDIAGVTVQRKFTGAVLTVEGGAGDPIVVKGIKPEQADEVRRLIQTRLRQGRPELRPDEPGPGATTPVETAELAPDGMASTPSADAVANAAGRLAILNRDRLNEADLLRKLADLHRAGVLSDIEFEDKIALVGRLVAGESLLIG